MLKAPRITNEHVAAYLAENPGKAKPHKNRNLEPREEFLTQYSAEKLHEALAHKGKPVDLSWVIKRFLDMYFHEDTQVRERIQILDRLMEFIRLGAIQDPALISRINGAAPAGKGGKVSDPFTLKVAK